MRSTDTERQPIVHPAAWKATDFAGKEDVAVTLEQRHLDALDAALAAVRGRGFEHIGRHDFPLPGIADEIAEWRHAVEDGAGLLLLRGFPIEHYGEDDIGLMWFGLGTHFGRAVSQSVMGDLLGHVVNIGGQDNKERAYRNARDLAMHTDRCDMLGMFCLQRAWKGGLSGYSSAFTIHNEILATRPDLLEALCEGYHYHRFGEQAPGEPRATPDMVPVFSEKGGVRTVVYIRGYAELAGSDLGYPLSDHKREALDTFDEVANRPDVRFDFMIEPGEGVFFNNCTVLHKRSAFEDHADPELKRHLLRLWLMDWDGRRTIDEIKVYKGAGGIPRQAGRTPYYAGRR